MRELTTDELTFVSSIINGKKRGIRIFGILFLVMTVISIIGTFPEMMKSGNIFNPENIMGLLLYGIFIILGLVLFIASFTAAGDSNIETITGLYRVKPSFRRGRTDRYYIGETQVEIPLAWLSSLEQKKEYSAEIYKGKKGLSGFNSIVLSFSGLEENLESISFTEMTKEEKELVKEAGKSLFSFIIAIGIPLFLVFMIFRFITTSDKAGNYINVHMDDIWQFIDFTESNSLAGGLVKFLFQYGLVILILISIAIVFIIKAKHIGKADGKGRDDVSAMSWKNWLTEYADFMENELAPVMQRSAANDSSVVMDYRKAINRHKQYMKEYKQFKKIMDPSEKSQFTREYKAMTKQVQVNMNR